MVERSIEEKQLSKIIHNLIIIINPFIPHISEEMWKRLGLDGLSSTTNWPKTKDNHKNKKIIMPIQINGKTRSLISTDNDEKKEVILEKVMGDRKIIKYR